MGEDAPPASAEAAKLETAEALKPTKTKSTLHRTFIT
jgi:hypothetical protein